MERNRHRRVMGRRYRWALLVVLAVLVGGGCGPGAPTASTRPAAASYEQYAVSACAAWDALFRAVGNPDTASGSDLSRSLDGAVAAGDVASAERLAAEIVKELTAGRQQVAL